MNVTPGAQRGSHGIRRVAWGAGLASLLLSAACATGAPWLVTLPATVQPVARLDAISTDSVALASLSRVFEHDLGFPSFPVTLRFYPGRDAFERALVEGGQSADFARDVAKTMTAVAGPRAVLLNEYTLPREWQDRVALFAHELTHCLQYELAGGRRGASDQWLREGFADVVALLVVDRLQGDSFATVRGRRWDQFRASDRSQAPRLADLSTFPQWVAASAQRGMALHAQAFLAADALVQRHGTTGVIEYFRRFAASSDRQANFRAVFGEDLKDFEAMLDAAWGVVRE